jgi:hypothetical protein
LRILLAITYELTSTKVFLQTTSFHSKTKVLSQVYKSEQVLPPELEVKLWEMEQTASNSKTGPLDLQLIPLWNSFNESFSLDSNDEI